MIVETIFEVICLSVPEDVETISREELLSYLLPVEGIKEEAEDKLPKVRSSLT